MSFPYIAMMKTGHWPSYGQPDPKALGIPGEWYIAAIVSIPFGFITAFIATAWLVCEPKAWRIWQLAVYSVGVVLWALNVGTVYGLVEWMID